jgi:hypothetical protein
MGHSQRGQAMLPEPIAVTLQVIDALEQVGARYVIGGSLASTVHGVVRTTLDADVLADLNPQQARPFADLLAGTFYLDTDSIHDAIRKHSSFTVIHLVTMFKVDVFMSQGRLFDRQQLERRQPWGADPDSGRVFFVASPEDTILAKLEWYRLGDELSDRQWRDILGVLAVQGDRLDFAYMRQWAAILDVSDLLARALAETKRGVAAPPGG